MKVLFTIIIFSWCCIIEAYAQQEDTNQFLESSSVVTREDSLPPIPSLLYFQKDYSLERDFNYEKSNKLKTLKKMKVELSAMSYVVYLGSLWGLTFLLYGDSDRELAWKIPLETVVLMSEVFLFTRLEKSIQKKIDVIQSSSVFSYNLKKNIRVDAVHFINRSDIAQHSYGLSLKINW